MFWQKNNRKRIYLDYSANTPVRPEVRKLLSGFDLRGNPGTIHLEGMKTKKALEEARQKVAAATFCRAQEIIFTSGATESNNLAVLGTVFAWRSSNFGKTPHIITTKIEHPSVIEVCKHLEEKKLAEVTYLEVNQDGIVDLKKFRESLRENTILASIIFASNEIGVIQPIRDIVKEVRHFKKYVLGNHEFKYPMVHTDASQAPLYEEINFETLHIDLMTLSSEKIGGPVGVGVLFVKSGTKLEKILMGGSQEMNLRPGTENVAGIVGFARALELAVADRILESARVREIQKYCFDSFQKNFSGKFIVNGSRENRLPNNVNITFPGFDSEILVIELDARGIAVSEKSACNTEEGGESYVIEALRSFDTGSLRISFGHETRKGDIDRLISALREIFQKYANIPS